MNSLQVSSQTTRGVGACNDDLAMGPVANQHASYCGYRRKLERRLVGVCGLCTASFCCVASEVASSTFRFPGIAVAELRTVRVSEDRKNLFAGVPPRI